MKNKLIILSLALINLTALAEDAIKKVDRTAEATKYAEGECIQYLKEYLDLVTYTELIDKGRPLSVIEAIENFEQDMEKNGTTILNNATAAERGFEIYKNCVKDATKKVLETKYFKEQSK